jgi:NAD(P)H-nitrite reductase large subunit
MSSRQDRAVAHVQVNPSERYLERADVVIIGNGIAGLAAAIEARRHLPDRPIVMITDQLHPTINTPALKQFAIAKLAREQLLAYPAGTERAERIHVVNAHVEEIDAQSKYVGISGNHCFGYNSLLIATGSLPVGLPEQMPGRNFDGVMTLHRLEDYLDFRRRLPEVREAVVIGGGVHACETVSALLYWNIRVHWLIRGKTFMGRMLDQAASEMVLNNVRRAGAIIHTETEIKGIVGRIGAVAGVITNDSQLIACQLVLTCTGTQPVVTLAEYCSIPMQYQNGILVDSKQRTSVRDIYAAGDVAALRNPQTGTHETRAQWYAAVAQGRIAGAMMAGNNELAHQPLGVPWHATQVGELSMLTVGEPLNEDSQVMILTDTSQGGYRRLAIIDDRLVGYLSVSTTQPDSLAIKHIIDEGQSIRDVTNALLKGNFDARGYLSQQKSHAVKKWITGQLSTPSNVLNSAQPTRALPDTDPVVPVPTSWQTSALSSMRAAKPPEEQHAVYEEEPSAFTGNLPAVLGQKREMNGSLFLKDDVASTPENEEPFVEDIGPFTGNLPAITGEIVGSRQQSTTSRGKGGRGSVEIGTTRKLWAYVENRA